MLSLMQPGSAQWSFEAKQARAIKCSWGVKAMYPIMTADDIHEKSGPRD